MGLLVDFISLVDATTPTVVVIGAQLINDLTIMAYEMGSIRIDTFSEELVRCL